MAFAGDDDEIFDPSTMAKMQAMTNTATFRDELWEAQKAAPLKIIAGVVVGGWLLYRLLIK